MLVVEIPDIEAKEAGAGAAAVPGAAATEPFCNMDKPVCGVGWAATVLLCIYA